MTLSHDTRTTLFEDAVDVPMWLEEDRLRPFAERARRDRAIARAIPAGDSAAKVRGWWRHVSGGTRAETGNRLDSVRSVVTVVMLVAGTLAGAAVALAAFSYDGTYPVNVVRLLALLVAPQLVLVALTLLMMPPRVPVLRPIQDALRALNPGALAAALFRRIAPEPTEFSKLFGTQAGRGTTSGRFAKWQLIYWSQAAAVAFNVAALATAAVLIMFTDLAFGWSTTLAADPTTVQRVVEALAWPWRSFAPDAVPELALIERSQFFRLDGGGFGGGASRTLTGWWSFSVLAIATYGLLPRLVLLSAAAWRLRAATRALLLDDPRVTALLDRMATPEIETGATEPDEGPADDAPPPARPPRSLAGAARGVIWSHGIAPGTARDYARDRLGLELTALVEAGGSRELGADREAVDEIARAGNGPLLIFTPAWEPPLLEFLDFLSALRERAGKNVSIVVTPVPEPEQQVSDVERDTWARAIGRLADPKVYVETGTA